MSAIPRPTAPTAAMRPKGPKTLRLPPWGWIEWVLVLQIALPALLFVPVIATSKVRTPLRVCTFAVSLAAGLMVAASGRRPFGRPFPARPWLVASVAWLCLQVFNALYYWLLSGVADVALNLAVLLPAFWAPTSLLSKRQIDRVMMLLLLCNALGSVMAVLQFYRPDRFNPPVIPQLEERPDLADSLMFETADGRKVLRPCGLSDTPGHGGIFGSIAVPLGIAWALRPVSRWKRLLGLGSAGCGMMAVLLSQGRALILAVVACVLTMAVVFALRRDYRRFSSLAVAAALATVIGLGWAMRAGGGGVVQRFYSLVQERPDELFQKNRGHFVEKTFGIVIWLWPMGAGLGRHGMIYAHFGDKAAPPERSALYSELSITDWAFAGGVPMLILYPLAIGAAMFDMMRIALRTRDPEVATWGATVFGMSLSTVATCFAGHPFLSPQGMQFWILTGMIHVASERARAGPERTA